MLTFTRFPSGKMSKTNTVAVQRCRTFATNTQRKQDDNLHLSWKCAKPYNSIPGPNLFQHVTRSMPGGKYHGLEENYRNKMISDEYGCITRFPSHFGQPSFIMITDPNDFELVFRTEGQWPYRPSPEILNHYRHEVRPDRFTKGMTGLSFEQGENWAKMRSIASPILLKPSTVNQYIPTMDEIAIEFVEHMKTIRDNNHELPATFLKDLNAWSMESISYVSLNKRINIIGNNRQADVKALKLLKALDYFFYLIVELEMKSSIWRYFATPKYRKFISSVDRIHDTSSHYIDQSIVELKKNPTLDPNRESILEKLLKVDGNFATTMAEDTILAGVDTTSSSIAYLIYNLAKNPDKQDKLREELKRVRTDENGKLTTFSFNKIPYLRACIKESMRVSPITTGSIRNTGKDIVMKDYRIPKGTLVIMATPSVQRDNAYFKDGDQFIPERWLSDKMSDACPEKNAKNPFTYLPFGFGARSQTEIAPACMQTSQIQANTQTAD